MKILFPVVEFSPLIKVGELSENLAKLVTSFQELGHEVKVCLPFYAKLLQNNGAIVPLRSNNYQGENIDIAGFSTTFWTSRLNDLEILLIKNNHFFSNNNQVYGYDDDCYRFTFYCRAIVELLKYCDWQPDITHVHDWHTALLPLLLQVNKINSKTLMTIHDVYFQGICEPDLLEFAGLSYAYFSSERLEYFGKINLLKAGLLYADILTTNSTAYLNEIQMNPGLTRGLNYLINQYKYKSFGVTLGIDDSYNPETDTVIPANYAIDDLSGKAVCKTELQRELNLPLHTEIPLLILSSLHVDEEEVKLLNAVVPYLVNMELQIVIIGNKLGDFEKNIRDLSSRLNYCSVVSVEKSDENMRKLLAGADILLDTSIYGYNDEIKKISLKYGVLPIVFRENLDLDIEPNRFKLFNYTPEDLINTLKYAINKYYYMAMWNEKVKQVMNYNLSWSKTVESYIFLYKQLIGTGAA